MDEQVAIVVEVRLPPGIEAFRSRLDPSAALGFPAHVTLLAPIPGPIGSDPARRAALREAVAAVPAFDLSIERTGWFGSSVLWLDPEPAAAFRALIEVTGAVFPDVPPYEGRFPGPRAHLTIGQAPPADRLELVTVDPIVTSVLPMTSSVHEVTVLAEADAPDGWRVAERIPLA